MDWTEIDCNCCRERFMCDRVKYNCPRNDPPLKGNADELTSKEKLAWALTYKIGDYKVPKELETYLYNGKGEI